MKSLAPHNLTILWSLAPFLTTAVAFTPSDDSDLVSYVTLPNHRTIKWNITHYDPQSRAPGYWFVAPYWVTAGEPYTTRWMPYQIGPQIFDQDAELVWTGTEFTDNQNAFDLRVVENSDKPLLSLIIQTGIGLDLENANGTVLNNNYEVVGSIPVNDKHEFYVYAPGKALTIYHRQKVVDLAEIGLPGVSRLVKFQGFRDVDYMTAEVVFEWDSEGKISLGESYRSVEMGPPDDAADYIHANSVEKTTDGDYLLSCRHTNTIYFISGRDGRIVWRLGGKRNSFEKDFIFSKQHDARIIRQTSERMVISFLDNGADELSDDETVSSAMIVELDLVAYTATLLNRYFRPDGELTRRRGSTQLLPNNNLFVSWSDYGYISEFDHDGRLLMEARFASDRFGNYRAYKYPWTAQPTEPPTLVASVRGTELSDLTTEFHVSWNGATEVKSWRFRARANATSEDVEIGMIPKKGFESTFVAKGYMDWVSVEAVDGKGETLDISSVIRSDPPKYWPEGVEMPQADDPVVLLAPGPQELRPANLLVVGIFAVSLAVGSIIWLCMGLFRYRYRRAYSWVLGGEGEGEDSL
ncbi:hypothetical protein BO94DRAFT_621829 [Aspergillus sclerotioniger CBS 115572]|uniref:Arylsulfotransferase n=1 Tax=Aspergillus sclerotioniger CBS 115572 TaxID=1450535 RepID=A0A317X499_9EURO|nr:hypothetical protein BO94DRAFT_621829 [Aspergillus sclerotioniger CBS 115572]PWY93429.1 hypothetical protein BO94DRAFT_621829 [Aspergillus sclerotioniger CBS 115572]